MALAISYACLGAKPAVSSLWASFKVSKATGLICSQNARKP